MDTSKNSDKIWKMIQTIFREDYDTFKKALHGISLEELEEEQFYNPLVEAVKWKRIDVVKLLLEKGVNVNAVSLCDGDTPLGVP